jgi:hypothetical protein
MARNLSRQEVANAIVKAHEGKPLLQSDDYDPQVLAEAADRLEITVDQLQEFIAKFEGNDSLEEVTVP